MRVRGGGENGQRGAGRAIAPGHDEQGLKDRQESQVVFIVLTWPAGCLGHCEEHSAQPALTPVSFSCALRGMARLWLICRLWHMLFPQSGRPFLCLLYLTTISALKGSDQPSLSPLLLPCRSHLLASHTGVSWYRPAFLSRVPNTVSGMWPPPNKCLWREMK